MKQKQAAKQNYVCKEVPEVLKMQLALQVSVIKAATAEAEQAAEVQQDASAPAAGTALQLVAVPARTQQQPQILHGVRALRPAQIWFGLRLPMLWQQQAGAVVVLFGSRRVVRGGAAQDWWLIVGVVRFSHVIQAGPWVCLVCAMHVAMLHITPVPRPRSQVRQALSCHAAMLVVLCLSTTLHQGSLSGWIRIM